jgi:hypothetical protein
VAQLHRGVLAVVADDNQDRPAVALRRTQRLDDRVVEERAVADQCGDRPLGRAELAPTGRNISFPVIKAFDNKQIVYGVFLRSWPPMTKLLDQALAAARSLPPDAQDDIARVVLRLTGADDETPVPLRPEEQAAIAASKAAAARGEFATDEQVRAVWAKHGL